MDARPAQQENHLTWPQPFGSEDARELLARTFELPSDHPGLLTVLREYRAALVALLTGLDAARGGVQTASAADDPSR